jgi:hypothetical protein
VLVKKRRGYNQRFLLIRLAGTSGLACGGDIGSLLFRRTQRFSLMTNGICAGSD